MIQLSCKLCENLKKSTILQTNLLGLTLEQEMNELGKQMNQHLAMSHDSLGPVLMSFSAGFNGFQVMKQFRAIDPSIDNGLNIGSILAYTTEYENMRKQLLLAMLDDFSESQLEELLAGCTSIINEKPMKQ